MLHDGLIFTFLTGVLWCGVGILYGLAAGDRKRFFSFLLVSGLCFILSSWLIYRPAPGPGGVPWLIVGLMLIAGCCNQAGFLALRAAMVYGDQAIAWSIAQSAMVCPFLAGILLFHERAGAAQWCGVALILAGLAVLALHSGKGDAGGSRIGRGTLYALLAFVLLGVQQILSALPSQMERFTEAELRWRLPVYSLCGLMWIFPALREKGPFTRSLGLALLYGLSVVLGQVGFLLAIDRSAAAGYSSLVFPLAIGSCIVLFGVWSTLFRKEPLTRRKAAGFAGILAGILLLALGQWPG